MNSLSTGTDGIRVDSGGLATCVSRLLRKALVGGIAALSRVLPTSLRESRFSMAYRHPYARHLMTGRQSCRSTPRGTRNINLTNEQGRSHMGVRREPTPPSGCPPRSGSMPWHWQRGGRPPAWPNSDGYA
jgi:hypothetical protein